MADRSGGPTPADVQTRFERLCAAQGPELTIAMHAHGLDPSLFGMPSIRTLPSDAVLDDMFANLSLPPRAPLPFRASPAAEGAAAAGAVCLPSAAVRAILSHPPRAFSVPGRYAAASRRAAAPQEAPAPGPMQQLTASSPHPAPVQRPALSLERKPTQAGLSVEPAPSPPPRHLNPPERAAPTVRGHRHGAVEPGAESDLDRESEFGARFAHDTAVRKAREERKRPYNGDGRGDGGAGGGRKDGHHEAPRLNRQDFAGRRGACVVGDDENDDAAEAQRRSGRASRADRELNRTLAKNPYCAAFNAQEQQNGNGRRADAAGGAGFQTAASRLAADRRASGKRARTNGSSEDDGRGNGGLGTDRENGGDDVARTVTRAVLGPPRRPRFTAPRPSGGTKRAQPGGDGTTRDDLPEIPNVEPKLVEMIMNEALDKSPGIEWEGMSCARAAARPHSCAGRD
jgi:hypothetical protein